MELWEHQKVALERSRTSNHLALFWEPGCGKSKATGEIIKQKCQGSLKRTLILCPLSVVSNWKRELEVCGFRYEQIVAPTKSGPQRLKVLEDALWDSGSGSYSVPRIVVLNYEALLTKSVQELIELWLPEILVADESHKLKSPTSKRSKLVHKLALKAKYRYILTGTNILAGCEDLFQQFKVLDLGETFGNNFFAFRHEFFFDKNASWSNRPGHFPDWQLKGDAFDRLTQRMAKNSMSIRKEDCLSLPPFVRVIREAHLSSEQKRLYKEMNDDLVAFLKENDIQSAVQASIAMVKALKLQQITSGFLQKEDMTYDIEDVPRLKVLEEIVDEICPKNKVIIWATFKANYRRIRELLSKMGLGFVELHGGIGSADRQLNLDRFEKDPSCHVMMANQGAGGVGVNMISASYSVYYSKNFKLEDDIQSEARNYRGGSEIHSKITRIDIVSPETIDEHVNKLLANKKAIGDNIFQCLR